MSKPKRLKVVKVVYSDPVTTVFWSDGTNTIAWCDEQDTYNEFTGFMLCVLKKIVSPQSMRNIETIRSISRDTTRKSIIQSLLRQVQRYIMTIHLSKNCPK